MGAAATMFCVGVGATGLADTALSRSLPPPQAASITLSAVAVQVVRRMWGCLDAMLRLQGSTYCTKWTMEKLYSWFWTVPDVSAKKHQSQQGEGGSLSCGSDDGCRRAVVLGALSWDAWAIRQQHAVADCFACALPCAALSFQIRQIGVAVVGFVRNVSFCRAHPVAQQWGRNAHDLQ